MIKSRIIGAFLTLGNGDPNPTIRPNYPKFLDPESESTIRNLNCGFGMLVFYLSGYFVIC